MCAVATGWQSIPGRTIAETPVAVQNLDGRLEVFAATKGEIVHAWQQNLDGDWNALQTLGSRSDLGAVTAVRNEPGWLEAIASSRGGHYHIWQREPNGGWVDWVRLGAQELVGQPVVNRHADGRLEVAVVHYVPGSGFIGGDVFHITQLSPGGAWTDWMKFDDILPDHNGATLKASPNVIALAANGDGRLELFAVEYGTNNIWHRWQKEANGDWETWSRFSNGFSDPHGMPTVGRDQDGRLELFATDSGGSVFHRWQTSAGGGWSDWAKLGTMRVRNYGKVYVALNHDGRLEVFARPFEDKAIWHRRQTAPGAGWTDWASLGRPPGMVSRAWREDMAIGIEADGRLALFARAPAIIPGTGDELFRRKQIARGTWG